MRLLCSFVLLAGLFTTTSQAQTSTAVLPGTTDAVQASPSMLTLPATPTMQAAPATQPGPQNQPQNQQPQLAPNDNSTDLLPPTPAGPGVGQSVTPPGGQKQWQFIPAAPPPSAF